MTGTPSTTRSPDRWFTVVDGARLRGVPDVAADSSTAMSLMFTGRVPYLAQGTSAAAPLWAA